MNFQFEFFKRLNHIQTSKIDFYFTGEIYNLEELEQNHQIILSDKENFFETLHNNLGPTFFKDLNGIFILFIHHLEKNEISVVRDHLGLHPFYYTKKKNTFYFSDYDLNLCKTLHIPFRELNPEYFLSNIKVPDFQIMIHTSFKTLEIGHYLNINLTSGEIKEIEFWNPIREVTFNLSKEEILALTEQKIRDAIKIRNKKEVKKGFHISGGLDCSVIAGIVQEQSFQNNRFGFSWSPNPNKEFKNLEFDERLLVIRTCKHLNIETFFSGNEISKSYFIDPRFLSSQEIAVLEKAQKEKIKLIFSGYGGDEFVSAPFFGLKINNLKKLQLLKLINWKKSIRKNLRNFLDEIVFPFFGIIPKKVIRFYKQNTTYLNPSHKKLNLNLLKNEYSYSSRKEFQLNSLKRGHLAYNVNILNQLGENFDITYSFPFLDKDLVAFIFQLSDNELMKMEENRPLLRELAKKLLPKEVASHIRKTDPSINEQSKIENKSIVKEFLNQFDFNDANYLKKFFNFDTLQQGSKKFFQHSFENEIEEQIFICTILCLKYILEFEKYYEVYTK